jgi:antitoxin (DNA-binding transcriptional repressor) of toxin-antitoxin stability system
MLEYQDFDAERQFSQLLNEVEQGEIIRITRGGNLVAVMCSPDRIQMTDQMEDFQNLKALRQNRPKNCVISQEEILQWKQEGRA